MEIRKAVITAAGANQRTLPLQTLIDRDGTPKSALQIVVEEALRSGVQEIGVVIQPGDQGAYEQAVGQCPAQLHFITQNEPRGFGHAVLCARPFTGKEAFLLLVGDHLYLSHDQRPCAAQLLEVARVEGCSVSGVQATYESKLPFYGTVGGRLVTGQRGLYQIDRVVEKPTPTEAEQHLIVPGLRAGYYLCFFGMHVLTPAVMDLLAGLVESEPKGNRLQLSSALAALARRERYLALEIRGQRHDVGVKYGLLKAQLALALSGQDREEVLAHLVEHLARRPHLA
jgi:UTP--glucose-1-phosphate uridylyltransferase